MAAALEDTLLAPKRALVYDQEQVFVFRVAQDDDGPRAERLLVRVLIESEDVVHLEGDLTDGERLIVAGQAGLKDGARIRSARSDGSPRLGGGPGRGLGPDLPARELTGNTQGDGSAA